MTAAEMRAVDRATIDEIGLPAITLMETAGRAVADAAMRMMQQRTPPLSGHVAVVCGPGNNGGDGFVAARVLRERGLDAVAYVAVARDKVIGDAGAHLEILERAGGVVRMVDAPEALGEVRDALAKAALVVDALFGTGPLRAIEGHLADVIDAMNLCRHVLAVDIPSGLDADTGRIAGAAISAERTLAIAAHKVALASSPGFARCGEIEVADIGIPSALLDASAHAGLMDEADVSLVLPRAGLLDHKGRRGHVLVIGGMPGMRGAGRLAAMAALRSGAGLVTLATAGDAEAPDSIMVHRVVGPLGAILEGKSAIVIGPGLGQSELAAGWLGEVLASGVPAVIDADALNLTGGIAEVLANAAGPIVITPHPGEAGRLLGTPTSAIEADRLASARALVARTHAVVVLKGARTIICDGTRGPEIDRRSAAKQGSSTPWSEGSPLAGTLGDEYCAINPTGGPELATAGSGDVLAGVIGALLAQGLAAVDAARAGVFVHGRAGDRLAKVHGGRGVVSSDLPLAIAGVIKDIPCVRV